MVPRRGAGGCSGVMPGADGDVGDPGGTQGADGRIAEGGRDLGSGAGADRAAVLVLGDVAEPVNEDSRASVDELLRPSGPEASGSWGSQTRFGGLTCGSVRGEASGGCQAPAP